MYKFYTPLLAMFFALSINPLLFSEGIDTIVEDLYLNETVTTDSLYILFRDYNDFIQPAETDIIIKEYHTIDDRLQTPFIYYLPPGYMTDTPTQLLIYLHGGVSRAEFIEDYEDSLQDNPFIYHARKHNMIILFPMGNMHTTWWSERGMDNITSQIRYLKGHYNIDDDRIYLTGFSDGGSGAYHFSMIRPNDYAAFYPLSGNMLVGSAITGMPAYTSNMRNRYLRAVNTDLDGLYPAERMRMMIELAQDMGANLFYLEYWGIGHTYEYGEIDLPLMLDDMNRQVRNIFRPSIYWETAEPKWGRCDWLEITEIDTLQQAQDWHFHKTMSLPDDRVLFGFQDDRDYEESGVQISSVVESSVSEEIGLNTGDVIIAMDDISVETISDLLSIRNTKKRGDEFTLTILRSDEEFLLEGAFPPVTYHEVFNYDERSGAVQGTYRANIFDLQTSRVSELAIFIHPDMVNMDLPVRIKINGEDLYNDFVDFDRDFMTANFRQNRDRSALWINRIIVEIPD